MELNTMILKVEKFLIIQKNILCYLTKNYNSYINIMEL